MARRSSKARRNAKWNRLHAQRRAIRAAAGTPAGPGAGVSNLLLPGGDNFLLPDAASVLLLPSG